MHYHSYQQLVETLFVLLLLLIAAYGLLWRRTGIALRPAALFYGFISLSLVPLFFAAEERLVIEGFAALERELQIPLRQCFEILRFAVPLLHVAGSVLLSGCIAAAAVKKHATLHALAVGLLYPIAVAFSSAVLLKANVLWAEPYIFIGGDYLVFTPLAAAICFFGSRLKMRRRAAYGLLCVNLAAAAALAPASYYLNADLPLRQPVDQLAVAHLSFEGPQLCSGALPLSEDHTEWGRARGNCPPGFAAVGGDAGAVHRHSLPSMVPALVSCCPLPAPDVLTDEHVTVLDQCPDGYVATGGTAEDCHKAGCADRIPSGAWRQWCALCKRSFRCTKVNTKRYQLGAPSPGAYWGASSTAWKHSRRVTLEEIPSGLRYGLARRERSSWHDSGCIGLPFGSLLSGKAGKRCQDFSFRQLQYAGTAGDPPAGTPVQVFPRCKQVVGLFDDVLRCAAPDS